MGSSRNFSLRPAHELKPPPIDVTNFSESISDGFSSCGSLISFVGQILGPKIAQNMPNLGRNAPPHPRSEGAYMISKQIGHKGISKQIVHKWISKQIVHKRISKQIVPKGISKQNVHKGFSKQNVHNGISKQNVHKRISKQNVHKGSSKQTVT